MKTTQKTFLLTVLASTILSLNQSQAAPVVFTIDQSQSQVSASGTVAGSTFSAQGTGALTTSYSGSIKADVSGSTIQFTGGSTITAQNSGTWQPGLGGTSGSASANYGPKATVYTYFTVYGAIRNVILDLNSPVLNIAGGEFDGNGLIFSITNDAAVLDYNASGIASGSIPLAGYSTNALVGNATLSSSGGKQTLTIPIDADFTYTVLTSGDTVVHLSGQIVAIASASGSTKPVIQSLSFSGQNVKLAVQNATDESQVQVSTNLVHWSPASVTTTTDGDTKIYTTPMAGSRAFFRIQQ